MGVVVPLELALGPFMIIYRGRLGAGLALARGARLIGALLLSLFLRGRLPYCLSLCQYKVVASIDPVEILKEGLVYANEILFNGEELLGRHIGWIRVLIKHLV